MTTILLTFPPPSLAAVKDSMFIYREGRGGRGGMGLGPGAWGRGGGRGSLKKKKKNIKKSHTASPQKNNLSTSPKLYLSYQ